MDKQELARKLQCALFAAESAGAALAEDVCSGEGKCNDRDATLANLARANGLLAKAHEAYLEASRCDGSVVVLGGGR